MINGEAGARSEVGDAPAIAQARRFDAVRATIISLLAVCISACGGAATGPPAVGTRIRVADQSFAVDGLDRLHLLTLGASDIRVREVVGNRPQDRLTIPVDGVPRSAAGIVLSGQRILELVVDICPDGFKNPDADELPSECDSSPKVRRFRVAADDWSILREDDLTDLGNLAYAPASTWLRLGTLGSDVFLDSGSNASVLLPGDGPPRSLPAAGCPVGDRFYAPPSAALYPSGDNGSVHVYDVSGRPVSTIPLPIRPGAQLASFQLTCSAEALFVLRNWVADDSSTAPDADLIALEGGKWTEPLVEGSLSLPSGPISASMISVDQLMPIPGEVDRTKLRRLLVDSSGVVGTVDSPDSSAVFPLVPLGFPDETTVADPGVLGREFVIRRIIR